MIHTLFLATLLAQNATCSDIAVTSARVANVTQTGSGLNHYTIAVTTKNMGSGEPSNALQFIDIYKNGEKKDARSVPPLGAGQSYTFNYGYNRSSMAGDGTITLKFQPDMRTGQDCNPGNDSLRLAF